ncbi:uncharacterized protein DFL_004806 [Arthrobotrys flagrans]|uniref:Uncharacterized protein n=1 Tax=Arthrobotrys flagrans TaxID=97331 RepID=A0A437A612_ARTFL|nr:hypothetical protein DFL_004806 [Arthrobotrys flagrans]
MREAPQITCDIFDGRVSIGGEYDFDWLYDIGFEDISEEKEEDIKSIYKSRFSNYTGKFRVNFGAEKFMSELANLEDWKANWDERREMTEGRVISLRKADSENSAIGTQMGFILLAAIAKR